MTNAKQITAEDIKVNAKFKCDTGIVWIIDALENHPTFGILISTSMEGGKKGNYRDVLEEVVSFLNEEKAIQIA